MNVRTQHTQAHGSNNADSKKNVQNTKTVLSTTPQQPAETAY